MKLLLSLVAFWCIVSGDLTLASSDVMVRWTQEQDCEYVDYWELEINHVVVADTLMGTCGGTMAQQVHVAGVGVKGFRLRAVTADGFHSDYSNEVTLAIPFAAPGVVGVELIVP